MDRGAVLDEYENLKLERALMDQAGNYAACPLVNALLDARIAELREVLAGKRRYREIEGAPAKGSKP